MQIQYIIMGIFLMTYSQGLQICNVDLTQPPTPLNSDKCFTGCPPYHQPYSPYATISCYGQPALSPVVCGWCISPQICQNGLVVGCSNGAQLMMNEFCCFKNCSFCWLYGCLACVIPSQQYISNYDCVPCVTPQICQNSQFIACSNGFQKSGSSCVQVGWISTSGSGYYIQDGHSYPCNSPLVCSQNLLTGCSDPSNQYLSNNICLPCPSNGYCRASKLVGYPLNYHQFNNIGSNCYSDYCIKCPNMFYCITCKTGYWLYLDQFCCPQNCSQCSFNSCQRCVSPSTQYINGFDCTNCVPPQICQNSRFIGCSCGYTVTVNNGCLSSGNTSCSCTTMQYYLNGVQQNCPANAECSGCQIIGCTPNISYYLSDNQCLACTLPLICQSSIVVACQGPYYLTRSNCFPCQSSLCATCKSQFKCSSCINNYWLYQREYCCGHNCAQCNLYQCLACVSANSQYINGISCNICSNAQICQNSSLVGCSAGYYLDSISGSCTQCPYGCLSCTSTACINTNCSSPVQQYYFNSQCNNCPTNSQCLGYQIIGCIPHASYYLSQNECISCAYPLICSQSTIIQCQDQFYLTGNSCRPCLPLNCATCQSQSECSSCLFGYWLYDNQYCCGQNCAQCNISGCLGCVSPNSQFINGFDCQDCGTTYTCQNSKQISNQTLGNCSPNDSSYYLDQNQCIQCSSQMKCQNSSVIGCNGPYYLSGVNCSKCSNNCATCSSQYVCQTCISGYNLYDSQFCCAPNCITCAHYQCYSCLDPVGQFVSGINCLSCPLPLKCQNSIIIGCNGNYYFTSPSTCTACGHNCASCSSVSCFSCLSPNNQYLSGSQCLQCLFPNICTNSRISSCSLSYYLTVNQQCVQCPTQCLSCDSNQCYSCIPPCKTCDFTTCLSCITPNWYVSGTVCRQCPTQCATCDEYVCKTCLYPNQYISGYTCLTCPQQCATCNQLLCITCMSPCKTCDLTRCYSCVAANYYLQDSICIKCGLNCEECTATECIKCSYQNSYIAGQQCNLCPQHCLTCDANTCFSCQPPCQVCDYAKCLTCQLPNQYRSGVTCITCPTLCLTCDVNACLTCLAPCMQCDHYGCSSCENGYYLATINRASECQEFCASIIYQPYQECNDGNKLSRDGCTNCKVDPGYTCSNMINEISKCFKLPIGCIQGVLQTNLIFCTICQSGYLLKNSTCTISIENQTEPNVNEIYNQPAHPTFIKPNQTICIQINSQCDSYLNFNFQNMYQNNDMYFSFGNQIIFENIRISNITITDYPNTDFTYNQTFNQTLYLKMNFLKSINRYNMIQLSMDVQNKDINQSQVLIVQPNPQEVLSNDQKQTQENVQTSMQSISTTIFITLMLTPLLGGFAFILQFLDIIAWLSTFYYLNITYTYNVNLFLQTVSFNQIFLNLPQLSTSFNQASDPYYFTSPYKFMQNSVDPLFINNILQPLFLVATPICIYLVSKIYCKIFPSIKTNTLNRQSILKRAFTYVSQQALIYQRNILSIILRQIILNMLDIFQACILQIISNPSEQYLIIKINTSIAIATIIAVVILLYQLYRQTQKHYLLINSQSFYTYEPIYEGLNAQKFQHRLYGCLLLYSKIAYTLSLVYFYDQPLLQTSFCTCPYFLMVTYVFCYNPYKNTEALLTQGIPNMCVFGVLSVTVFLACNQEIQILQNTEILGWVILGFIWTSMSIQLFFLLRLQVKTMIKCIQLLKVQIHDHYK